jgi:two-component system, NtrC family, response regulator AtoC
MPYTVLIIEDEIMLAKNMTAYLERHGYTVTAVLTGEEGLEQLDTFRPDMVLLDYQLPKMNGLEVLERLRSRAQPIKAIMITGQGNREVAAKALQAGAYEYRSKPLALSDLKLLLDKALGVQPFEQALS